MAENDNERLSEKTKKRIDETERVLKAILKGFKELEEILDEPIMPQGEYCGIKFDE